MDCEAVRDRLIRDPRDDDSALVAHVDGCRACAAYAARVRAVESRMEQAVRFDVPDLRARFEGSGAGLDRRRRPAGRGRWLAALGGAAAGVAVTVAVWMLAAPPAFVSASALASAVVSHWYDEPQSWVRTEVPVGDAELAAVLDGKVRIDLGAVGRVTYARSCYVAGRWVPHLVVQGEAGPFMVLLLPEHAIASPVPLSLEDESLEGAVIPVGHGSIAVLGGDAGESAELGLAVAEAVEWTTT